MFIPYLAADNYYGIEPQLRLVSDGLEHELGRGILEVKRPHFEYRDDFLLSIFDTRFLFFHLCFTGGTDVDLRNTAG